MGTFNKFITKNSQSKFMHKRFDDKAAALIIIKLWHSMDKYNIVSGTPESLSTEFGITMWDFKAGIKGLKQLGLIRKYSKKEYMISPDSMFNGNEQQYWLIKARWDTQTTQGLR